MGFLESIFGDYDVVVANDPNKTLGFFTGNPSFAGHHPSLFKPHPHGEELYKVQAEHLSNALLMDDYNPQVPMMEMAVKIPNAFKWIDKGEVISGSFAMKVASIMGSNSGITADDVDIYFCSKEDAQEWAKKNKLDFDFNHAMCAYGRFNALKINLIWGVTYTSIANLLSRFDIRACSMALDPNTSTLHMVEGAYMDTINKNIVFNPVPRGVSVRRLVKYIEKGFTIDKHQRLFFAELIRTDIYSTELELVTQDY